MPSTDTAQPAAGEPAAADPTADTAVGERPPLAARPDPDPLARAVARARIGNQLFATQARVELGRYQLLEQVGAGGMGVVWGAWDPELERRVAIKLVKATLAAARDRILLEGQALARLSHPNVVTVYDVGVVDEQVYIVMEWVRGQDLRAYARQPRTLRELVAVYRAAGEGLAAAHAAGLIHRDFKPENAVRGDDGRVRVLDFGLARSDGPADGAAGDPGPSAPRPSSELTRGAGTPRYMPPEQAEGRALTPAVDQYAFSESLREALVARNADGRPADLPGWLAAIVARGTAREPAARFPSMAALLRALGRDPARIWRRRLIVAGAVAASVAAFAIGNLRAAAHAVEPCTGAAAELAAAVPPAARAQLADHLRSLGAYGSDEAARLAGELDRYGARWAASHRGACLAHARGELTAQLYERDLACLARARVGLATAVELLGRVPGDRLGPAIVAARGLPDSERCLSETLGSTVDPPAPAIAARADALANAVARLRVLAQAADPSVEREAARVVGEAEQLGYLPLVGRAYLVQALDLIVREAGTAVFPALDRAAITALDAGDQVTFVEAYARQVFELARTAAEDLPANAASVTGALGYVEHIARRLGDAAAFERPLLYNNAGVARMAAGDKPQAKAWFARAIDEPRTRAGDVELVAAFSNLALNVDDPAERDRLFTTERDRLVALLGANHIRTLQAAYKRSVFATDPLAAAAQARDACQRLRTFHAGEAGELLSQCAYELGWLADARGDRAEARAAMAQVEHARAPIAQAYLAALDGRLADAAQLARRAAAALGTEWWSQMYVGDGLALAGRCAGRLGQRDEAIRDLRAALATYAGLELIKQAPYVQRRIARTQAALDALAR